MRSDILIRYDGLQALRKYLGPVDAERFIVLISRDAFDYTEWQRTLWQEKTIDELYDLAKKHAESATAKQ